MIFSWLSASNISKGLVHVFIEWTEWRRWEEPCDEVEDGVGASGLAGHSGDSVRDRRGEGGPVQKTLSMQSNFQSRDFKVEMDKQACVAPRSRAESGLFFMEDWLKI